MSKLNKDSLCPIVVAVSGGGRTLANLIACQKMTNPGFVIRGVISSRADCRAVDIAKGEGIDVFCGDFSDANFNSKEGAFDDLNEWLQCLNPSWIALAGFLKRFPLEHAYGKRVVNIHPALLPNFGGKGMYGIHVHKAVIAANEPISGATVHFVSPEYDEGQIIAQARIAVTTSDPSELAARVFEVELKLYPEVLRRLARGQLPLAHNKVLMLNYPGDFEK